MLILSVLWPMSWLRCSFHYGHPDVFDKLYFMSRGGVSKASKAINLSEDIFAGYNTVSPSVLDSINLASIWAFNSDSHLSCCRCCAHVVAAGGACV